MKNSKNIDKIFLEGLHTYERQPRSQAWEKLEARLQKPQNKVLPIWWKYASAASVVLFLGVGGYWFSSQKTNFEKEITVIKKPVIIDKQHLPILEKTAPQIVTVEKNIEPNKNLKLNDKVEKSRNVRFAQLLSKKTIKVKEIKQVAKMITVESKKIEELNTIVLVLENTKPMAKEEIIVLNMIDTKEVIASVTLNDVNVKKETRLSKIWQQLKRAKNGENVNWNEVGIKPQKMLARADAKIENILTKRENNEE